MRRADDNESRQVLVFAAQTVEQPRTHAWPRERLFARVHLQAGAVVVDVVRHHRTNDAQVVDAGRQLRKQFAHLGAGRAMFFECVRRGQQVPGFGPFQFRFLKRQRFAVVLSEPRFRIKRIDVRRPARHKEENNALRLRGELRWLERQRTRFPFRQHAADKIVGQQSRQPQHPEPVGESAQHLPPVHRPIEDAVWKRAIHSIGKSIILAIGFHERNYGTSYPVFTSPPVFGLSLFNLPSGP